MVGRHDGAVPSKDQRGFRPNGARATICSDSECPGCSCVKPGQYRPDLSCFRQAKSQQATDIVAWYYQDVQPHYPGMMAAGEHLSSAYVYSSDLFSFHPGPFLGTLPHVEHS